MLKPGSSCGCHFRSKTFDFTVLLCFPLMKESTSAAKTRKEKRTKSLEKRANESSASRARSGEDKHDDDDDEAGRADLLALLDSHCQASLGFGFEKRVESEKDLDVLENGTGSGSEGEHIGDFFFMLLLLRTNSA
jgi:hypothetical protein